MPDAAHSFGPDDYCASRKFGTVHNRGVKRKMPSGSRTFSNCASRKFGVHNRGVNRKMPSGSRTFSNPQLNLRDGKSCAEPRVVLRLLTPLLDFSGTGEPTRVRECHNHALHRTDDVNTSNRSEQQFHAPSRGPTPFSLG